MTLSFNLEKLKENIYINIIFKIKLIKSYLVNYWERMRATISPYNPRASAKIRISIIPTKILSCCPSALTPASPAIPIANPAALNWRLVKLLKYIPKS